jgi:hypothetical protein
MILHDTTYPEIDTILPYLSDLGYAVKHNTFIGQIEKNYNKSGCQMFLTNDSWQYHESPLIHLNEYINTYDDTVPLFCWYNDVNTSKMVTNFYAKDIGLISSGEIITYTNENNKSIKKYLIRTKVLIESYPKVVDSE